MFTLRIEHAIRDFDTWKDMFDSDPANRKASGVRRYAIHRPVGDPGFVMIDLEFDTTTDADAMLAKLQDVWLSPDVVAALGEKPKARIVETVESAEL